MSSIRYRSYAAPRPKSFAVGAPRIRRPAQACACLRGRPGTRTAPVGGPGIRNTVAHAPIPDLYDSQEQFALAALSTAGCLGDDSADTEFDGPVVLVGPNAKNVFSPGTDEPLTIDAGTRVRWDWRSANHNIQVRAQPEDADWQESEGTATYHTGHTHEHTFEVPGEYHYVCVPHEGLGMVADLIVE